MWFLGFPVQYLFWLHNMVAGMGFEPHDFRVMSPTSYQAALPRDIHCARASWCRKPGSNRYDTHVSRDFKSRASANSAIPAKPIFSTALRNPFLSSHIYYSTEKDLCQAHVKIIFPSFFAARLARREKSGISFILRKNQALRQGTGRALCPRLYKFRVLCLLR